jgi:hypothetical protein
MIKWNISYKFFCFNFFLNSFWEIYKNDEKISRELKGIEKRNWVGYREAYATNGGTQKGLKGTNFYWASYRVRVVSYCEKDSQKCRGQI